MAKAVIMTVDDEPDVLNAVERDLRNHFRSDYRIMKAGSARQALETTRRLKERDQSVALFLVDERMPMMSGTEFLVEARRLHPDARRVLLTAYADTQAAIAGINNVGLDYYLMKPWDPPEEHLYPVLDDLLGDWSAHYRPPFGGVRVAGTSWSPACHDVKDFLSRNQVPYRWIDLETDAATRTLAEELSPGLAKLPIIFFPDGTPLLEPDMAELAERIGLQTKAQSPFYDLIIVGGGPSGLAASVYSASEGLRTLLLDTEVPGGQAGTSSSIENYLGFPSGISGMDLARRATSQARRFGAEVVSPRRVASIAVRDPYRIVTLDDGTELSCFAVLISTGMAVRKLEGPGIDALVGAGVFYGAALSEATSAAGRHVGVVGGGNSAGQAVLMLARHAEGVHVLVRGDDLRRSMSSYLVDRIEASTNIEVLTNTRVAGVHGERMLERVEVCTTVDDGAQQHTTLPITHLFVFIGTAPHSEVVSGLVATDKRGFVLTGTDLLRNGSRPPGWPLDRDPFLLETSVPGIFAAGDIRAGSTKRVASAIGEGSAAVGMIHRYLESV